jgi:hemolysin III
LRRTFKNQTILSRIRTYSRGEELANALSHAAGILLGGIAAYVLLSKAFLRDGGLWEVGSVLVYLFGMLSCYTVSTLYHSRREGRRKLLLQRFDHALIYVHIAGTYTPFTLITLRMEGVWGWSLFAFIWLSALIGVWISFRKSTKHSYVETVCYVVMGCSILIAFKPLIGALGRNGELASLYWLMGGGASYIIGAGFYSLVNIRYMHTVFHFFVLGGSLCHIIAIYLIL